MAWQEEGNLGGNGWMTGMTSAIGATLSTVFNTRHNTKAVEGNLYKEPYILTGNMPMEFNNYKKIINVCCNIKIGKKECWT